MNPDKGASGLRQQPRIIELVGPAGSGKTTLIEYMRQQHTAEYGHIGPPQPSRSQKLVAAIQALPVLLRPNRMTWQERGRLYAADRAIRAAMSWFDSLSEGTHLVDEGPYRILHDYACRSEAQLLVWRAIAIQHLERLAKFHCIIIRLETDPETRRQRRIQRMGPLEQRDPNFNKILPPRERKLLFLRDELSKLGPENCALKNVDAIDATKDVPPVAGAILRRIKNTQLSGRGLKNLQEDSK